MRCWILFLYFALGLNFWVQSQNFSDNFSDGNFTANPAWQGDVGQFTVNGALQLQLNNPGFTTSSYLSTPVSLRDSCTWEFFFRLNLAPSSSNLARIYLQSSSSVLTGSLNGYYVQIGETGSLDPVEVFRQTGTNRTSVFRGTAGTVANNPATARVRITRNSQWVWTVAVDYTGGTNFVTEGSFTDSTHRGGQHLGVVCIYTSTNGTNFLFDDFQAGPLFFDLVPPVLDSAKALAANQVDLFFNEPLSAASANNAANYSINNGINVLAANLNGTNPNIVNLTVSNLTNLTSYQVTASNIQDVSGNTLSTGTANFTFFDIQPAAAGDVIFSEIFADPTPQVGLPNFEYVELYNRSNKVIQLNTLVFNDGSNRSLPNRLLLPDSFVALVPSANLADFAGFPNIVGITGVSLTNAGEAITLKTTGGSLIDSLFFSDTWYRDPIKKDGGWSLELRNPNELCKGAYNWIASVASIGGTPGTVNSVFNTNPDNQAPGILSSSFINATQIRIIFDDFLDNTSALVPSNYSLSGGLTVSSVNRLGADTIILTLSGPMINQTNYTLTVQNVADCLGNAISSANSSFIYYDIQPATLGDVIFTEIFADPSPPVGLPLYEYVELYNRSNKVIQLNTLVFNDGSNRSLPSQLLLPGGYVVLVPSAGLADFAGTPNLVSISSMSLTNSGEPLSLRTTGGVLVDSVFFRDTWYRDLIKKDGGWSLELINPNQICKGQYNWIASNDPTGGTPGRVNSVFDNTPDTQVPSLMASNFISNTQIRLIFNDILDPISATNPANYVVNGGVSISSVQLRGADTVILTLGTPLSNQNAYTVTIQNVADCVGNAIGVVATSFTYYDVFPAVFQDIIFNELMIDPTPVVGLPDAEYVELYNRSNKAIRLHRMTLSHRGATSSTTSTATLPDYLLLPNSYVVLHKSSQDSLFAACFNCEGLSLPDLNNTGAFLILRDTAGAIIDSILYDQSWYRDNSKTNGGWSLELINPAHLCKRGENWRASTAAVGGSPGSQNAVYDPTLDQTPPQVSSLRQYDTYQILLRFNEVADPLAAVNPSNYTLTGGLQVVNAQLLNSFEILLSLNGNMTDGLTYTLTLNGIGDCVGNQLTNANFNFTYYQTEAANRYDLLINEIMADANPVVGLPEVEWVEVYNRSNKVINLENYVFSDGSTRRATLPFYILAPGQFVLLCSNADTAVLRPYGNVLGNSTFPDLDVSGDDLTLSDPSGRIIDAVPYRLDWYGSSSKSQGGWTLERINPNRACEGSSNWLASNDPTGGTPGRANSLLQTTADGQAPDLIRAFPVRPDTLRLFFSEAMDEFNSLVGASYQLTGGLNVVGTSLEPPFFNTLLLYLDAPLQAGVTYTLSINNQVTDCAGNPISLLNTTQVALPQPLGPGDLVINEVLFNPVTGGSDFVEFYNTSSKVVNIQDLIMANTSGRGGPINQTRSLGTPYLLFPNEYVAISPSRSHILHQYQPTHPYKVIEQALPTYPDNEGTVVVYVVYGQQAITIDSFYYQDDYHHALLDDDNGVSLERIDFFAPTNRASNWHSGASATRYATPGYQNSAYRNNVIDTLDWLQLPSNRLSPDGDGFEDFLLINYAAPDLGYVATLRIYNAQGQLVKNLVQSDLMAREGTYQWDGSMDNGDKALIGLYVLTAEIIRPDGQKRFAKRKIVLAGKL